MELLSEHIMFYADLENYRNHWMRQCSCVEDRNIIESIIQEMSLKIENKDKPFCTLWNSETREELAGNNLYALLKRVGIENTYEWACMVLGFHQDMFMLENCNQVKFEQTGKCHVFNAKTKKLFSGKCIKRLLSKAEMSDQLDEVIGMFKNQNVAIAA